MDAIRLSPPRRLSLPVDNRWGAGEMNVLDFGDPERPVDLVFVHANGFNAMTYRSLLAPLSGTLRIWAPDLRGHGLTTLPAEPNGRRGWADHRDDLIALLDALDGPPAVLAGHSMGGNLALRAIAERVLEPVPTALVLSAPMLDVLPERVPLPVRDAMARMMCTLRDPRRPAWKWSERPGELPAFRQVLLTHDPARYSDELWWREQRPELVMGPGSWGWVRAALDSIRMLARPGVIESVDLPVFLLATTADRLVGVRAMQRMEARLPHVRSLWFGSEAAHEILREIDPVRDKALAGIDAFLDEVAPR